MNILKDIIPTLEDNIRIMGLESNKNINFRLIRKTDAQLIFKFFQTCSMDTIYYRFMNSALFNNIRKQDTQYVMSVVKNYINLDLKKHMSIVAIIKENDDEQIISEGRYICTGKNSAEVAIMTADNWQRKGLATKIAIMLKNNAILRGISIFEGDILRTNQNMLNLFKNLKIKFNSIYYQDSFHFEIHLKGGNKNEIR